MSEMCLIKKSRKLKKNTFCFMLESPVIRYLLNSIHLFTEIPTHQPNRISNLVDSHLQFVWVDGEDTMYHCKI